MSGEEGGKHDLLADEGLVEWMIRRADFQAARVEWRCGMSQEDARQELLLVALKAARRWRIGKGTPKAYLRGVLAMAARTIARSRFRDRARHAKVAEEKRHGR